VFQVEWACEYTYHDGYVLNDHSVATNTSLRRPLRHCLYVYNILHLNLVLWRVLPANNQDAYDDPSVAVCCSVWQCVAVCCRVLQPTLTTLLICVSHTLHNPRWIVCMLWRVLSPLGRTIETPTTTQLLQCVAACCSAWQHVAVCCRVLPCVAVATVQWKRQHHAHNYPCHPPSNPTHTYTPTQRQTPAHIHICTATHALRLTYYTHAETLLCTQKQVLRTHTPTRTHTRTNTHTGCSEAPVLIYYELKWRKWMRTATIEQQEVTYIKIKVVCVCSVWRELYIYIYICTYIYVYRKRHI